MRTCARARAKESWLAERIEKGAAAGGASSVGAYAAEIDTAVKTANDAMRTAIETGSGDVAGSLNLDGFIAERHHADTFNLDAAAKGSPLRAEVLGSQGRNSVDVVIKDADGRIVRRYQSKYGQDAKATRKMFREGDYRGQRKLVPSGQEGDVPGSTDRIEADGVRSRPLTKDGAKRRQDRAQQDGEIETTRTIQRMMVTNIAIIAAFITVAIMRPTMVSIWPIMLPTMANTLMIACPSTRPTTVSTCMIACASTRTIADITNLRSVAGVFYKSNPT